MDDEEQAGRGKMIKEGERQQKKEGMKYKDDGGGRADRLGR